MNGYRLQTLSNEQHVYLYIYIICNVDYRFMIIIYSCRRIEVKMTGNTSDILSANISNNASLLVLTEGITDTFYISLFFIQIPGITTNLVSLYMIISESRHTKLPTNFLLLMLCLTDFTAVCTTCLWHTMSRFGTVDTYNICAIKVYTQTFCPTFSGVVSVFMAIDRALAFCMPFFYRIHITKKTWSFVCLGGFLFISSLCILPHAGLGSMWNPRYKNNTVSYRCSAFQFPDEPKKKTFLILYLTIAFTLICAIILCNTFVMVAILKLRKRSVDAKKSAGSGTTFKSATEIRFAVIVGVLACVFVICWGPYYVSISSYHFFSLSYVQITKRITYENRYDFLNCPSTHGNTGNRNRNWFLHCGGTRMKGR